MLTKMTPRVHGDDPSSEKSTIDWRSAEFNENKHLM